MHYGRRFLIYIALAAACFPSLSFAATSTPVCSISLTPNKILVGQSVFLRWQSTSTATGTISHIGLVGPKGSFQLQPAMPAKLTFDGVFYGPGGTATCSGSVVVMSLNGTTGTTGSGGIRGSDGGVSTGGTVDKSGIKQAPGSGAGSSGAGGSNTMAAPQVPNLNLQTSVGRQQASGNGLIPCGRTSASVSPTSYIQSSDCQLTYLVATIRTIINFLLGLSIPISVALFAWAGILYFTAQGDTGKINRAHKIFTSVLIGFIITVSGWLIVQTVVASLTNQSFSWNSIALVPDAARPRTATISSLFSPLTALPGIPGGGGGTTAGGGTTGGSGGGGGPLSQCLNSNCSPSVLQEVGFSASQANAMSCIAMTENSGGSGGCNGNACGTFQIMITANPLVGSACGPSGSLNCPVLCRGSVNGQNRPPSCDVCVQAAQDPVCNAQAAANLYAQNGYTPWTVGNQNAANCIAQYGNP